VWGMGFGLVTLSYVHYLSNRSFTLLPNTKCPEIVQDVRDVKASLLLIIIHFFKLIKCVVSFEFNETTPIAACWGLARKKLPVAVNACWPVVTLVLIYYTT
jgi:hypothetical protein